MRSSLQSVRGATGLVLVLLGAVAAIGALAAAGQSPEAGAKEETVGEPQAPGMMALLEREMLSCLKDRGITDAYARFRAYSGRMLNDSASGRGGELSGNCRLSWYDEMMREPVLAPRKAEEFTRELHLSLRGGHAGLGKALAIAREKLDARPRTAQPLPAIDSPEKALDAVRTAATNAQINYAAALAPLSPGEVGELVRGLYPVLVGQNQHGHTLVDRGTGRRLCDILEKLDRSAMLDAADDFVPLADPRLLDQLGKLSGKGDVKVPGAEGDILQKIDTPAGAIVVGGPGANTYKLDEMPGVCAVIDVGGDDTYHEGAVSYYRPVLAVIDLDGNDSYRATASGVQGGAVLGVSFLLDRAGNDSYYAKDVAQGSCLAGVGILIDCGGDDAYVGLRRVQGQALAGVGILLDRAGADRYRGALWTQGFGGPLGFAVLDDLDGADYYYTGGYYLDSYEETPGLEGWGQGVGSGLRAVSNGGIGVILDGGGDDVYEYDYLAHGGGYWCGLGFARDFGGNDRRLGATLKSYNDGQRTQSRFQRFGCGWGCHYALGFLFDDAGHDTYGGTIMGLGFAWDDSVGALCDFGGDDRYEATGGGNQGNGAQAGLGILYDYDGDDAYLGGSQGNASSGVTYHPLPACGGNFSFVVDYGGKDQYGCGAQNNSISRRGSAGGFIVDRPRRDEATEHASGNQPAKAPAGG